MPIYAILLSASEIVVPRSTMCLISAKQRHVRDVRLHLNHCDTLVSSRMNHTRIQYIGQFQFNMHLVPVTIARIESWESGFTTHIILVHSILMGLGYWPVWYTHNGTGWTARINKETSFISCKTCGELIKMMKSGDIYFDDSHKNLADLLDSYAFHFHA